VLLLTAFSCNQKKGEETQEFSQLSDEQKLAYSFGISAAARASQDDVQLDPDLVAAGVKDYLNNKPQLDESAAQRYITGYAANMAKYKGDQFLRENKKREGVITLPSGLQYEVMTEGTGKQPTLQNMVTTHYHGTLIDGTVFDSSVERGQPAQFKLNGVIKGWQEALSMMKEGSKWKLFIPSHLAYGGQRVGTQIPAYSTLIFEVELISVND
jgi:FKBP-type peptidyl-prolyl cis-trans isomerase FklB